MLVWALALLGNDIMDQLLIIIHIVLQLQQHTADYDVICLAQSHLVHFSTLRSVVSASTVLLNRLQSERLGIQNLTSIEAETLTIKGVSLNCD